MISTLPTSTSLSLSALDAPTRFLTIAHDQMTAMDSSAKSRPRNPRLSQAQPLPIQGSEENFQRCCATSSCATWEISIPLKAPSFGHAAFFRPEALCTKQMHGKWKKPLRRN
jgi:hypothetical protein